MSITAATKELVIVTEMTILLDEPSIYVDAASVQPGEVVHVTVFNGPGTVGGKDWIGLYLTSETIQANFIQKVYMTGTGSVASPPMQTTRVPITMPVTAGTYEFRFFENDLIVTPLAESNAVVVL